MMLLDPLTTLSHELTWQIESLISPLPKGLWSPNFAGKLSHSVTWHHVTNKNQNFFSCKTPVATKLYRMETYHKGISPLMLHDPVITWSHKLTWQIKTKYFPFHKANGSQHWQSGNLWWGKLTHYVRWSSDDVITQGHITSWKLQISPFARSMTSKHDRFWTYCERNPPPPMDSHDPLTMYENTHLKMLISKWKCPFVRPHLDYGDIIYDQSNNKSFCNKIQYKRVQYNAALAITGAIRGTSQAKLYHELGLEWFKFRR